MKALKPYVSSIHDCSIYRIQLDHNYGYGYVRLRFMPKNKLSDWQTILYEPLDIYHKSERTLHQDEWSAAALAPPLLSFDFPEKADACWHYIGMEAISTYEIPKFFSAQIIDYRNVSDYGNKAWFFINELGREKPSITNYEQAKKHGIWRHLALSLIVTRITMIWMKRNGVDYHDLYKDSLDDLNVRFIYNLTTYVYE